MTWCAAKWALTKRKDVLWRSKHIATPACPKEFFIDNLLVRIHSIIVKTRWTGLAPWESACPRECTVLLSRTMTAELSIEKLLHRSMQRFRGGLVFKAHRLLYHSTLGLRIIQKIRYRI